MAILSVLVAAAIHTATAQVNTMGHACTGNMVANGATGSPHPAGLG